MISLLNFQIDAVQALLEKVLEPKAKQTIVLKSPTGSGKTIMLLSFIDEYIKSIDKNVSFIWLCPGKGNLEEQSYEQMKKFFPNRNSKNLLETLSSGFEEGSTTFINWEMVTKTGNRAITDGEEKNLYDRIAEAHRSYRKFIVIVDEEHSNDTGKAQAVINAFSPIHIIRVSATAHENPNAEFIEIDEQDVINEGIIARAIYVNEDIPNGIKISNETQFLLEKGDAKRKEVKEEYKKLGININPLVIVQLPNDKGLKIEKTEKALADMGYTYENKMVGVWLADKKENVDDIKNLNDGVSFLIMKQAISTGWDCPRAKILVKLREAGDEDFEIQTIGRIRRMPERKHYDNEILDNCYVYTFDEQYKAGLFGQVPHAYSVCRMKLKKDPLIQNFKLKRKRLLDSHRILDSRAIQNKFIESMRTKYRLDSNYENNKVKLESSGYIVKNEVIINTISGKFVKTMDTENVGEEKRIKVSVIANTSGIYARDFMHSRFEIHKASHLDTDDLGGILLNAFNENGDEKYRLLSLDNAAYYAFIINNEHQLKEEFRDISSGNYIANLIPQVREDEWTFLGEELIKYNPNEKSDEKYDKNVYEDYSAKMVNSVCGKSQAEIKFEDYCQKSNKVKFYQKNGDMGDEYFSVPYSDGLGAQHLFYPDYLLILDDGKTMIIETKGGESKGKSKNIDRQVVNKFNAFKTYAEENGLKWGFVRDIDTRLYINNTEYVENMNDPSWRPIEKEL